MTIKCRDMTLKWNDNKIQGYDKEINDNKMQGKRVMLLELHRNEFVWENLVRKIISVLSMFNNISIFLRFDKMSLKVNMYLNFSIGLQ